MITISKNRTFFVDKTTLATLYGLEQTRPIFLIKNELACSGVAMNM